MFERIFFLFLKNKDFKGILNLDYEGKEYVFGRKLSANEGHHLVDNVSVRIISRAFFRRVIIFGDAGFGESYFRHEFEAHDIKKLLVWFVQNKDLLPSFGNNAPLYMLFEWGKFWQRLAHRRNKNTIAGSKKNIKEHYDVSNDFYRLWLDETMAYSSAIFGRAQTLKKAQENKYRLICEQLRLNSGDHVLEIGTGWGGWAIFAAKNYGCRITTTTISENQFNLSRERIVVQGLEDKIKVIMEDYRGLTGEYDKIVSIEMMEALGHDHVPEFIEKCFLLLKAGGKIFFQCITYTGADYGVYQKNSDYIKVHIFPGGELISLAQLKSELDKYPNLKISSVQNIGQDYARTLQTWRENLVARKAQIIQLGFDEEFYRKWYYYFAYCEAGFETGYIDDAQILIDSMVK